jgi:hypothetical protein
VSALRLTDVGLVRDGTTILVTPRDLVPKTSVSSARSKVKYSKQWGRNETQKKNPGSVVSTRPKYKTRSL